MSSENFRKRKSGSTSGMMFVLMTEEGPYALVSKDSMFESVQGLQFDNLFVTDSMFKKMNKSITSRNGGDKKYTFKPETISGMDKFLKDYAETCEETEVGYVPLGIYIMND